MERLRKECVYGALGVEWEGWGGAWPADSPKQLVLGLRVCASVFVPMFCWRVWRVGRDTLRQRAAGARRAVLRFGRLRGYLV